MPNTRRRDWLEWFDTIVQDIVLAIESGETLIEVVPA